ncbi:pyridoxamine 5'-phosphate oxidase family protein [Amycolatopsis australiensis]|uniref:General stress protein 26 n=1 Tax=Amycolatopsis australiensis TaxID=546364 RepID=A0A1K1RXZ8_9PSEU|nr:pyridoxamine 5'-phosphate oxidase family protein [Amycolatopsis australiensis]SFW76834.1 General stress protein 26 [Amycolatopsis australiensis]
MVVESSRVPEELAAAFVRVAHRIVWCTLATVDRRGRPRSRVVHPIWEHGTAGLTGRLFTRPTPLKRAHLARSPYVSCSYWDPQHEVAVAECHAEFADDEQSRRTLWELFASTPEPLGFDPKILGGADHRDPDITVLKLTPWRLSAGGEAWRAA